LFCKIVTDFVLFRRQLADVPRGGWVVVDEIQRLPALLNDIHGLIEERGLRFVLLGFSARKLRRAGVNLLGGRALPKTLSPLLPRELGRDFSLDEVLRFGSLSLVWNAPSKQEQLGAHSQLYLKEEIKAVAELPDVSRRILVCLGDQRFRHEDGFEILPSRRSWRNWRRGFKLDVTALGERDLAAGVLTRRSVSSRAPRAVAGAHRPKRRATVVDHWIRAATLAAIVTLAGLSLAAGAGDTSSPPAGQPGKKEAAAMTFSITSPAFKEGGEIPSKHTCEGPNTSPALAWKDAPAGTGSLALIVDDPDAPDPKAPKMTWVHWVLYNIPPSAAGLAESVAAKDLPPGTREGTSDYKRGAWGGPCPPIGRHRYFFKLYALDTVLPDLKAPTKDALLKAMEGHILARVELMGTYQKKATR
jgi:Raf kinase inhibitor-like YbhB/YbcL family protein